MALSNFSLPLIPKSKPRVFPKLVATLTPPRSLKSNLSHEMLLFSASPTVAEIGALAGYDVVVVDLEHGPGSVSEALHCNRAVKAAGSSSVIRVQEVTSAWAKKAMDVEPNGVMFPKIENAKEAEYAVSLCCYPPDRVCGCAYNLVKVSDFGLPQTYLQDFKERLLIMSQLK
ncbi:PREDICTED: uncharacterized protein LOC104733326 [Camelina sativa]|uniref:Uncharacterized protein LOC104733326 n=1 Tax=Camelina sativa TaxID=90675 RepID=A0ABM0V5S2_CAMSA|nr:PREDICTED: uncharacterized protein LOC104733326 [Camelina sativa]